MSRLHTLYQRLTAAISLAVFNDATHWALVQIANAPMVEIHTEEFTVDGNVITGRCDVVVRDLDANPLATLNGVEVSLPIRVAINGEPVAVRMVFCDGLFDFVQVTDRNGFTAGVQRIG
jgi:hypothetical protein